MAVFEMVARINAQRQVKIIYQAFQANRGVPEGLKGNHARVGQAGNQKFQTPAGTFVRVALSPVLHRFELLLFLP